MEPVKAHIHYASLEYSKPSPNIFEETVTSREGLRVKSKERRKDKNIAKQIEHVLSSDFDLSAKQHRPLPISVVPRAYPIRDRGSNGATEETRSTCSRKL